MGNIICNFTPMRHLLYSLVIALTVMAVANPAQARYYGAEGTFLRLAGPDRYATSVEVSEFNFGAPASVDQFVIASGEDYPDALAAAPFAARIDAPLLLTARDYLPDIVRKNIKWAFDGASDLEVDVYVVGGPQAVSDIVLQQLLAIDSTIDVKRIQGSDRVETAANVAHELEILAGDTPATVFVASGNNYPDALSASGPASDAYVDGNRIPILLNRDAIQLDPLTRSVFERYFQMGGLSKVIVLGGTSVFSDTLLSEIRYLASVAGATVPTTLRLAGLDRYETSALIAEYFYGAANPKYIGVASGESFPDALVGGYDSGRAYDGTNVQPFLLVKNSDEIPTAVFDFFSRHSGTLESGIMYGGIAVLSENVRYVLEGML